MDYINQVTLAGVVADEPVGRIMGNGKPEYVATLSCVDRWVDSTSGIPRERTDWFRIVIYGRLGDKASLVMKKGVAVRVEGRLRIRDIKNTKYNERKAAFVEVTQFDLLNNDVEPSVTYSGEKTVHLPAAQRQAFATSFDSDLGPLRTELGVSFDGNNVLGDT